ncbi:MAG: tRNA (pseudouridine(54)-N(1))-methyltransferase TrmY [Nanoarchaeota archaeon]
MREFIYFSQNARTSGNWPENDLMKAGRMDIVINVIISSLFLSHKLREDVHLHLIFNGHPNPPMHLEFISNPEMPISKKDVGGLIRRMLYKCKEDRKLEVFPGCFIEKKGFNKLTKELEKNGKKIYVLDKKGNFIRNINNDDLKNSVFVIGDHEGLPKKETKKFDKISIGKMTYFASHTIVVINNELDVRGL